VLAVACRASPPPESIAVVDFIRELDRAERRPASYAAATAMAGGVPLPAITGPAPGRLTWTLAMPRRGQFRAHVAAFGAPVHVRIGVSDDRVYERVAEAALQPGAAWTPVGADLSAYAGWKFSLFYRPEGRKWRIVLSADAPAGPAGVAWGMPEIVTSGKNALEYAARRARLTHSAAP
jgi:hypothetical protein